MPILSILLLVDHTARLVIPFVYWTNGPSSPQTGPKQLIMDESTPCATEKCALQYAFSFPQKSEFMT